MEEPFGRDPVWALSPNFRCPVVGTCLTLGEQDKILKKCGYNTKTYTDYQVHHALMDCLDSENPVSRKTDRYIQHKHKHALARFSQRPASELKTCWREACEHGDLEGLFFVIMTRPDVPAKLKVDAFGDVHMLCHSNMNDILRSRKTLDREILANRALTRRLHQEKDKNRGLKTRIKDMDRALKTAKKHQAAPVTPSDVSAITRENKSLLAECSRLREALSQKTDDIRRLNDHIRKLEQVLADRTSENPELREETITLPACPCCDGGGCTDTCPEPMSACESCPKRILLVGGITKMESHYRDMVEAHGNTFVYHDGYIRNGNRRINDMVAQADLVLCPVNCISHNTCRRIKKLCKKHNTHCKMLKSASLTMVSRALTDKIPPVLYASN